MVELSPVVVVGLPAVVVVAVSHAVVAVVVVVVVEVVVGFCCCGGFVGYFPPFPSLHVVDSVLGGGGVDTGGGRWQFPADPALKLTPKMKYVESGRFLQMYV